LSVLATVLAGCGGSPREHFYTLSAGAAPESAAAAQTAAAYSVVVGPVTVPDVVDRPQLVVRTGTNQVAILEQQRWAEPLKSEIPRVLAENLAQLLGTRQVTAYPQTSSGGTEYRVLVDIQRFESALGGPVTINALWTVRRGTGEPRTGQSLTRESAGGEGYDAIVAAYSRALATVSRDIAVAIRSDSSVPH
jgi:uncharacterized lipoprotein YmbA